MSTSSRTQFPVLVIGCLAAVGAAVLAAAPLKAQESEAPLTPQLLREQLAPDYQAIRGDLEFQARQRQLDGNVDNRAVVDHYLSYLPMSPLEMLEIDMELRRYEIVIPRVLMGWHRRWIELHEKTARAHYGDAYVDQTMSVFSELAEEPVSDTKTATVGTNRNMAVNYPIPTDDYQGEIQLAVNPSNTDQIVAAANTFDDASGLCSADTQAIFFSSDGGVNWGYTCAPDDSAYAGLTCNNTLFGSDPALAWNSSGDVFLEYMLLCTADFLNIQYSIVVAKSTDGGATWNGQGVVANSFSTINQIEDKEFLAIDTYSGSPFSGRMYTCWDRNNDEKFAYSTDAGATWTEVDLPATTGTGIGTRLDLGCDVAVEDNGDVHVVFDTLSCLGATCNNEEMFYTGSTDGGVTWSTPVLVRDFSLVGFSTNNCPDAQDNRCIGPFGTIAVDNSGGSCDGYLYATFSDGANANTADVWVSRSVNGGATWTAPAQVNDDGLSNRAQFHPYMEVDPSNGQVVVAWHDTRNDSGNDEVEIFAARSTNCGLSFEDNVRVSRESSEFNNSSVTYSNENTVDNPGANPNQYGEYLGLDAIDGKAYVAWTDSREFFPNFTGHVHMENVGFATVDFLSPTLTFISRPGQDGWVKESTENSNVGGSKDAGGNGKNALRVGDNYKDRQFKAILSFDTSTIPASAVIQSVQLRVRRGAVTGTNPWATFGNMNADVSTFGFNGDLKLQNGDFQAGASATGVCTLSAAAIDGAWAECFFDAAGIAAVNRNGRTQVRLYFDLDDDDDRSGDYIGFYSGENGNSDNRPQLIVSFQ